MRHCEHSTIKRYDIYILGMVIITCRVYNTMNCSYHWFFRHIGIPIFIYVSNVRIATHPIPRLRLSPIIYWHPVFLNTGNKSMVTLIQRDGLVKTVTKIFIRGSVSQQNINSSVIFGCHYITANHNTLIHTVICRVSYPIVNVNLSMAMRFRQPKMTWQSLYRKQIWCHNTSFQMPPCLNARRYPLLPSPLNFYVRKKCINEHIIVCLYDFMDWQ